MMKPRTQFFIIIGLLILILGITWYSFSTRNLEPAQFFAATINRDCAPWDGSAFTVSIPVEAGTAINISIWQSPNFNFPKTFSFPDDSGQVGNVSYRPTSGEYERLSGTVTFERVEEGMPIEGRFNFTSERGEAFEGQFKAEWGDQAVLCG